MQHLFLTSSIGTPGVGESIRTKLGHDRPLKTAFITTPIEVEDMTDDQWYQSDRAALTKNGFDFFDYTITDKQPTQIKTDLSDSDIIYITGGHTDYFLRRARQCGFDHIITEFMGRGGIYVGTSAGSIIAGAQIPPYLWDEELHLPPIDDYSGFGFTNFIFVPHWGSPYFRDKYLGNRVQKIYSDSFPSFIMCNDHQYVEVQDDRYRIVDVRHEGQI